MILGMKVRKPDLSDMLQFNPQALEFHFSDSDLNLELDGHFDQKLIVHCYEYFDGGQIAQQTGNLGTGI